jgi:hypothetical protein
MDYHRFAAMLVVMHYALESLRDMGAGSRSKAFAVALAEQQGAYKSADRLGLANTPDHLASAVREAVDAAGHRPHYGAMNNDPRKQFDTDLALDIIRRMEWQVPA